MNQTAPDNQDKKRFVKSFSQMSDRINLTANTTEGNQRRYYPEGQKYVNF